MDRYIFVAALTLAAPARATPGCPIELGAIEDAKPNKLYLYFPPADDPSFPNLVVGASPAKAFDVTQLTSYGGTVAELENAIRDVVVDDYCEFNVKVISTTTMPSAPDHRTTVAIGTDTKVTTSCATPHPCTGFCAPDMGGCYTYGIADTPSDGGTPYVRYARVWAGTNQWKMGGDGGLLDGPNSTVARWAVAIGGSAAHEAGHTYGLSHCDGEVVKTGEGPVGEHIMPDACVIPDDQRAGFRRYFDDTSFGVLAANVGLSVQTLHNWDWVNPNNAAATSLQVEILRHGSTPPTLSWAYLGDRSPWGTPTVSGDLGGATFQGDASYHRFVITWSTPQAWSGGTAGSVAPAGGFHVGAAFSDVDYTQPNPILITKVTLFSAPNQPLPLAPRMFAYDTGSFEASDGSFLLALFNPEPGRELIVEDLVVSELPRVLALDAMVDGAKPRAWQGKSIAPWRTVRPLAPPATDQRQPAEKAPPAQTVVRESLRVTAAKLGQGRHVVRNLDGRDCAGARDGVPEEDPCEGGVGLDLFPSTMVYVTATVVDPAARHWDPASGQFVVGPVRSRLFYQFAGRHPDLNNNGVDDYLDIARGTSTDVNHDGVPDEAQPGLGPSHARWPWLILLLAAAALALVLLLRRRRH